MAFTHTPCNLLRNEMYSKAVSPDKLGSMLLDYSHNNRHKLLFQNHSVVQLQVQLGPSQKVTDRSDTQSGLCHCSPRDDTSLYQFCVVQNILSGWLLILHVGPGLSFTSPPLQGPGSSTVAGWSDPGSGCRYASLDTAQNIKVTYVSYPLQLWTTEVYYTTVSLNTL